MLCGAHCILRPYAANDTDALAAAANDERVARWMSAVFPFPYTATDARAWIDRCGREVPTNDFAIEVGGAFAGGIGIRPFDGESRGVAEFGYWLSPAHWGRGIATDAARVLVCHAFASRRLRRLEAHVFASNVASARVLEKCGFSREAILREAVVERDGSIVDAYLYALLAPNRRSGNR